MDVIRPPFEDLKFLRGESRVSIKPGLKLIQERGYAAFELPQIPERYLLVAPQTQAEIDERQLWLFNVVKTPRNTLNSAFIEEVKAIGGLYPAPQNYQVIEATVNRFLASSPYYKDGLTTPAKPQYIPQRLKWYAVATAQTNVQQWSRDILHGEIGENADARRSSVKWLQQTLAIEKSLSSQENGQTPIEVLAELDDEVLLGETSPSRNINFSSQNATTIEEFLMNGFFTEAIAAGNTAEVLDAVCERYSRINQCVTNPDDVDITMFLMHLAGGDQGLSVALLNALNKRDNLYGYPFGNFDSSFLTLIPKIQTTEVDGVTTKIQSGFYLTVDHTRIQSLTDRKSNTKIIEGHSTPVTNGCPATYTDVIQETVVWLRRLLKDFVSPVATRR